MRGDTRLWAAALVLIVAAPAAMRAQSGADILDRVLMEYERRTAGIDNYTLIQETMGVETVSYFERVEVDGRSVFRLRRAGAAGVMVTETESEDAGFDEFYAVLPQMMGHAVYDRRDAVDGHAVHVVVVNDLEEIDFGPGSAGGDSDFQAERGTFFIDADEWVVRRMVFEGKMMAQGEFHDVTSTADFRDFREVGGMPYPFQMVVSMQGLGEAMGPEVRAQLEEMKQQLDELPPAQRKMMEEMIRSQLSQFDTMVGEEGAMTVEIRVVDLKVNSGPPGA